MKKLILLGCLFFNLVTFSQEDNKICHKVAHVDIEYIMSQWSKISKVDSIIYTERNKLESNFRPTYNEYLLLEKELLASKYVELELRDKELQFRQLKTRVDQFSYTLNKSLVKKQKQLMSPLLNELKSA